MADILYEMFIILKEYSDDSRASKRCYINQMDELLHQLIEELMNPSNVDLDKKRISIIRKAL